MLSPRGTRGPDPPTPLLPAVLPLYPLYDPLYDPISNKHTPDNHHVICDSLQLCSQDFIPAKRHLGNIYLNPEEY